MNLRPLEVSELKQLRARLSRGGREQKGRE
jgi:hypothetical protein